MITSETSYKEARIIRDTWPSLYTYEKIIQDEKRKNHMEGMGKGIRREGREE
jgi:hypothetical protein